MRLSRIQRRNRIKYRIRKIISGTPERGRLSVYRSNKEIYAQIIDDTCGKTLTSASSAEKGFQKQGNKTEIAKQVGMLLAKRSIEAGLETVSFDRNGFPYHGRVRSLAEGAREGGLKF